MGQNIITVIKLLNLSVIKNIEIIEIIYPSLRHGEINKYNTQLINNRGMCPLVIIYISYDSTICLSNYINQTYIYNLRKYISSF